MARTHPAFWAGVAKPENAGGACAGPLYRIGSRAAAALCEKPESVLAGGSAGLGRLHHYQTSNGDLRPIGQHQIGDLAVGHHVFNLSSD